MAWVAVDKDGNEAIFAFKPVRGVKYWHDWQITRVSSFMFLFLLQF